MGTQSAARHGERRRGYLAERERRIAAIAGRQFGVVSRQQLLDAGLSVRTIRRRVEACRLHTVHRGVYCLLDGSLSLRGTWLAAVLACGDDALLSHRSAATLWGLMNHRRPPVEVTSHTAGRERPGIRGHQGAVVSEDWVEDGPIRVTTVARTLFDLAEIVDEGQLARAAEEADRLRLLRLSELEAVCSRSPGRRALRPIRRLIEEARAPMTTRTPLEDRVIDLCRNYDLPMPSTNVSVLGHEVDALWPDAKLIVEADGLAFHSHRAAFERDRKRDASRQVEGYRVVRLTHHRLTREPEQVAEELGQLLNLQAGDRRAAD